MHSSLYDLLWSRRCIMIGICIYIAAIYCSWWLEYSFTYVFYVDIEFICVCTFIDSKRYICTYRMRVYIFNRLIWLISFIWLYLFWSIVSDDEIIDLKWINIFHWKTVISTAVISLQSYLLHRFTVNPVIPFLYISPIFLGNIVVLNLITSALVPLPRPWREFSGYRWILNPRPK